MALLPVPVIRRIAQQRANATGQRYGVFLATNKQPRYVPVEGEDVSRFIEVVEPEVPAHA